MGFTDEQKVALCAKLPRDVIKKRDAGRGKVSYLPGWYVIRQANEVFGHDGWSYRVIEVQEVFTGKSTKGNALGSYQATVEVTVQGVTRADVGLDSFDDPEHAILQGIDKARKGSVTDALKRCLRTFGDVFGNSLYDKSNSNFGWSRKAEEIMASVEEIADDAAAVKWWRTNRDAITALDDDEQQEIQLLFEDRRAALAAPPVEVPAATPAPPSPQSVAFFTSPAAAPATAPQEPRPTAPVAGDPAVPPTLFPRPLEPVAAPAPAPRPAIFGPPPPAAAAPVPARREPPPPVTGVASAIAAMEAATTVEELRAIPKRLDSRSLTSDERLALNEAYNAALRILSPAAWLLTLVSLAKTDAGREKVFAAASLALGEGKVTEEEYGKVIRQLGDRS